MLIQSKDDTTGLNVCLSCFNGGCAAERDHAALHNARSGHPLALNIKRTKKSVQVSKHVVPLISESGVSGPMLKLLTAG